MSFIADDEILQDFLMEAGEILEQLNEQLVELEQFPDDYDLLNAVFRGFHTIKGGAGFLNIENLVEVCHRAEDVFNILRQGQRAVDAELMDAVLQVLDVVNEMFAKVRAGGEPPRADRGLIARLDLLALPGAAAPPAAEPQFEAANADAELQALFESAQQDQDQDQGQAQEPISSSEYEHLMASLDGDAPAAAPVAQMAPASDDITDDEFEALLDQLHGKGKHSGPPVATVPVAPVPAAAAPPPKPAAPPPARRPAAPTPPPPPARIPASEPAEDADADESRPGAAKAKASTTETTVRVDTQRLDDIMNMVGELVLVRNRLANLKAAKADEELANVVGNLDVVTADLQIAVMKTRMQPIKKVFGRFPRVVRDLARTLRKEVDLELVGEDTDLDKNLVDALADPLVHLVRNAMDHGIEESDDRARVGKNRKGKVILSAAQEGDHILLSIEDDGKGMDPDVLRRKAVEKGMMDAEAAARLDEKECYNLIFAPGFSTKTEISDVSGRGVGMDVVKTRIGQMNGLLEINSKKGQGTKIIIKLPLTLAILPTLMVILGRQPFALPLANVVEIFNLDLRRTNVVNGQLTIRVRDRAMPLFYLRKWLVQDYTGEFDQINRGHVVVVSVGNMQMGLVVDYLVGQEEVVIKPLGALLQGLEGMAGATITGDGKIALILDVPGLIRKYAHRS